MKINFISRNGASDKELQEHFNWLTTGWTDDGENAPGKIGGHGGIHTIAGKTYHTVDVMGDELVWMNEMFPKEKFTWYLWFESVFLVSEEMVPFLRLRWS